jgi:hypothetical protein
MRIPSSSLSSLLSSSSPFFSSLFTGGFPEKGREKTPVYMGEGGEGGHREKKLTFFCLLFGTGSKKGERFFIMNR